MRALLAALLLACSACEQAPHIYRISARNDGPETVINAPVALGTFLSGGACNGYAPFILNDAVYTGSCGLTEEDIRQRLAARSPDTAWRLEAISDADYRDARRRADDLLARNETALLEERGFRTIGSEAGNRFSMDEGVLAAAFEAGCANRRPSLPQCDELAAYRWSVALRPDGWLTIHFSHRDILNTRAFGAFDCGYEQNEWRCTREHE
jgi:hypothetical protein